eukprot:12201021-Ditylum_brightwellii.AAC.1
MSLTAGSFVGHGKMGAWGPTPSRSLGQHILAAVALPWPDVKVASQLCIGRPCKYVLQDGADLSDEWLLEHVVPNIASTFSSAVSLVFALPIFWAVFGDDASVFVSPHISQCIKEAYSHVPQCRHVTEN